MNRERSALGDGPASGRHRRVRRGGAVAAVALLAVMAAPWLSGSASARTSAPCDEESSEPCSLPESPSGSSPQSDGPASLSCETLGLVAFPATGVSGWSLPSWVESSESHVCVALDASALRALPELPEPEPSSSQETNSPDVVEQLKGIRSLHLFATGLLIFCSAAMLIRSRAA